MLHNGEKVMKKWFSKQFKDTAKFVGAHFFGAFVLVILLTVPEVIGIRWILQKMESAGDQASVILPYIAIAVLAIFVLAGVVMLIFLIGGAWRKKFPKLETNPPQPALSAKH